MGGPRAAVEQAQAHMLSNAHGGYSDDDVKHIVQLYFDTAGRVGLDPLLVVVQMAHETGNLSSFWSQEPRRNPAGIGVTGAAGEGLSFPDWTTAVRAHVGRLLAYVLRPGAENPTQSQLIAQALTFRALPPTHRGTVRTLGDLGGGVWAEDPEYAAKLVRLANNFRGHAA